MAAAVCALLFGSLAHGATLVVLDTSQSPFLPGFSNQGWWSDRIANQDNNTNYLVGATGGGLLVNLGDHRNFFTFDLSSITRPVVSATLILTRGGSSTVNESTETIGFYHVSTPAAELNHNVGLNPAIFDDLGNGTSYGTFEVSGSGASQDLLSFPLDLALSDLNAAAGSFFSIGGRLLSDDGLDGIFGAPAGRFATLELLVVPEPSTLVLVAAGLAAMAGRRARRVLPRRRG